MSDSGNPSTGLAVDNGSCIPLVGECALSEEDQEALDEVESELSQLLATGIQDTSILGNAEDCAAVWHHIKQQHGDLESDLHDEYGLDIRLKEVVRAFSEGSLLRFSDLVAELRKHIATYCELSDERLSEFIPIIISRKNLGEPFVSVNNEERLESTRSACLWVWESPSTDFLPSGMEEQVISARESRNLISRRYKTLVALKTAIKNHDKDARIAANEQLGIIYKKMLLEREKRERLDNKRKALDLRNQQLSSPFTKVPHVKDAKSVHSKDVSSSGHEKSTSKSVGKQPASSKSKAPNMLLNWLKSSVSTSVAVTSSDSASKNATSEVMMSSATGSSDISVHHGEPVPDDYDDMGATGVQMCDIVKLLDVVPKLRNGMTVCKADSTVAAPLDFSDFLKLCESHREGWMRYFTYIHSNRIFYVDTSSQPISTVVVSEDGASDAVASSEAVPKSFVVDDVLNNIRDTIYGDATLVPTRGARVFHMSDNEWKRPYMRLLIARCSATVKPTAPLGIESAMDYFVDSDEEWFEQYDVDDVDESGSEEEEDDDEESDWIVQDNPDQGPHKHTQNLCEVVKVFCLNRNWHWIVDGVAQNVSECCSVDEARKNGITIEPCDYGFGYEGYTKNPISDFVLNMRGHNIIMTKEDVQDFLKLCHAKHTKKESLISDFKELKPHCSTAELREKFKKYICRMKVDSTPQRWLVTTEAAVLFGIRDELDAILASAMEQAVEYE
ncbi:uncharacterized protein BXIN_2748 [Babesia sp. Xinjiang]|uniref:uncharacterized protein n=1 Tax=Babesia sp. Xinjiang TaxID=462227 RepID=UPI000A24F2BE|nr:uncharacterized protein BXIN_2748 [Babesia sp. Xinjiang]ORM41708.1 hypothetical protein BXIN_2748 [Babesia sp. Xinjiang]